ncbi:aminomethyl-transferring glycine dehydrogenase subunit GcvPA [Marispirochaeta aestuarii]|uniref:aminomethyl-transferring glycine dehydrogenase subunit GcvPA n=1 Tax=Marispirochaeta aestuarii TaxID=1963862 RepID=UPI0029C660ED|nr:aminomethyl-transferring glycine dehydrogenase subunit GcvPA [Marispirochaeta aestuarii]
MFAYLPHTETEIREMLERTGLSSLDELFLDIPEKIRLRDGINLPSGIGEYQVFREMESLSQKNNIQPVSFLGCGCYDHLIPAVIKHLTSRSEFLTAYTPYQAEMSQGMLQAIFEFQSLMCRLAGLDVSNASLYDGHTAAAEAAAMALNSVKNGDTILVSAAAHPSTIRVLKSYYADMGITVEAVPAEGGATSIQELKERLRPGVAGVIIQTPNVYGILEDLSEAADTIKAAGSMLIISANPLSLGICRSPGEWGADIAVGDCQPLGLSPGFGGPSAGYIAAREKLLRKLPGRISGMTLDREGRRGFVLTLQAREQHIKRQRATSNICSNQALAALGATVYLSSLGEEGLKEVALRNLNNAAYAFEELTSIPGVEAAFDGNFFNEFTLDLSRDAGVVVTDLAQKGYFAGVPEKRLYPEAEPKRLIVAVTEKRDRKEIDGFVRAMKEALT